jgi:hypothetical protein
MGSMPSFPLLCKGKKAAGVSQQSRLFHQMTDTNQRRELFPANSGWRDRSLVPTEVAGKFMAEQFGPIPST